MEAWYFYLRQRKFLVVFSCKSLMRILKDGYKKKSNKEITLLLLILGFIESDTLI